MRILAVGQRGTEHKAENDPDRERCDRDRQ